MSGGHGGAAIAAAILLALLALLAGLAAPGTAAAAPPTERVLVADLDAHLISATNGGALFNIDLTAPEDASPLVETAADSGAPMFEFLSSVSISPIDGRAYLSDLGSSGGGQVLAVRGGSGVATIVSSQPLLVDPFAITFRGDGSMVVVDWDSDPSALGPDNVGGAGHGALFLVDVASGALTLLADGRLHSGLPAVAAGASAFEDPVGVVHDPVRDVLYVTDLAADPLGVGHRGAVYAVHPTSGAVTLVSSSAAYFALSAVAVLPDGTPLVVDSFRNDSVVWALDVTDPDPENNLTPLAGGPQFSILENIAVDRDGEVFVVDSGEFDDVSGTFIVPPGVYRIDRAHPDPTANGVLVNRSSELVTPIGIAAVPAFRVDDVDPGQLPPRRLGCPSEADVRILGAGLAPWLDVDFGPDVQVLDLVVEAGGDAMLARLDHGDLTGTADLVVRGPFGGQSDLAAALVADPGIVSPRPPCSRRGDANCDGLVDGLDLARLGRLFGATFCDVGFEPDSDFNQDGVLDGADLAILATFFGTRP